MTTAPKLRCASFADHAQIARLQAENGLGGWSSQEWQHPWIGNPAYAQFRGEWPIGWILEADREIVGYFGNIPVLCELQGKRLTAACAHSWVVSPLYRAYSLAVLDRYLRQESADLCLANTVGAAPCESLPVPAGRWDSSWAWITKYTGFVASWLSRKKYPLPG